MNPYRENARWGALVGEHRAATLSWLAGALLGAAITVAAIYYIATTDHAVALQSYVGVFAMGSMTLWAANGWRDLRRVILRRYERGFQLTDRHGHHEIAWEDITTIDGQYVPGVRKKGVADEGNLVAIVVRYAKGEVRLPKELDGFSAIKAELQARSKAPWNKVLIANLMQRA